MASAQPHFERPRFEEESLLHIRAFVRMFVAVISRPPIVPPWAVLSIPIGTKASKKGDRIIFSTTYETPICIPPAGQVKLNALNGEESASVLEFEYIADIPTVSWDPAVPALIKASEDIEALGIQALYRAHCPEEIEADFPGYAALPVEKWIQLNTTTDQFVIQLKLQKMAPSVSRRDPETGESYMYGATRFIVQVDPQPRPKTDKDRALLI